jgi:hypothetical protein
MKLKRLWAVVLPRLVRQFVLRRGYVLIPVSEIRRMEDDAESHYTAMRRKPYVTKSARAYFNGGADHASKTAHRLRENYLPNANVDEQIPAPTKTESITD